MNISFIKGIIVNNIIPFGLIFLVSFNFTGCSGDSDEIDEWDSFVNEVESDALEQDLSGDMQSNIIIAKNTDEAVMEKSIYNEKNNREISNINVDESQDADKTADVSSPESNLSTKSMEIKKGPGISISDIGNVNKQADFNFIGEKNSNGLYSLWKINKMIGNYFFLGNTEDEFRKFLPDSVSIYCLFSEDMTYRLYQMDLSGPFYLNNDYSKSYNYNKLTGELSYPGIKKGGFYVDGNRATFSYFNPGDGKWYYHILTELNSLDGELFSVNNDQLKIKMWNYYIRDQLSNGDGSSEGTVDIAINYNGNKPVNEQSPIVALLRSVEDDGSAATAGNTISSKSDNITITGIPDGTYYLFVIRLSNILKSKDPEPGDVYTIYDGSYYGGPDPVLIEIDRGGYQNLTVNFDDTYSLPDDIRGELLCKLNSVRYDFEGNRIMVTVDIDTSAFDSDPLVCANLFAPAAYKYGRARFDRGQKKELDLQRVGTSSKWEGSALLEDYNESGKWKIGMIQIEGTVDNDVNLVGYSMENNGSINSSYWYYDWSGENDNVKIKTDVNVPEFSFSSPDSDVSGPELIIIDIDESSRDSAEFSVTVENVGSSGHRIDDHSMDLYPVKLYLFHEDSADSDIDEAYLLEFKEMPIIEGVYAQYKAVLDYNDLPGIGEWKVKAVQLIDGAGNSSFYFVYDDEIYRGGFNFWGNDGSYCLFNFGPELPLQSGIPMIIIDKPSVPQIYVAGFYNMDSKFSRYEDDEQIPCLWKNGEITELDRGYKTFAHPGSLYVEADTAYIAGYAYSETDSKHDGKVIDARACFWMNKKIYFIEENYYSKACSVTVEEDDIYVAGYYRNDKSKYVACYWTISGDNITRIDLITGMIKSGSPTRASSISVSAGIVHVAGDSTDGAERKAYHWKYDTNGNQLEVNELAVDGFQDVSANSIYIFGRDVYIAADYHDHKLMKTIACLWINGEKDIIHEATDTSVKSIYVSESNVYFCGEYKDLNKNEVACYWQLTDDYVERTDLGQPNVVKASSIYVSGKDVYISGSYENEINNQLKNAACYWENDVKKKLDGYNDHNAEATAIFMVQ